MKRLSDYRRMPEGPRFEGMEDVQDRDLILHEFRFAEGTYGLYTIMELTDDQGQVHTVSTGAKVIVDTLQNIGDMPDDGLAVRFIRKGRYWTVE